MDKKTRITSVLLLTTTLVQLTGCSTSREKDSLRSLDVRQDTLIHNDVFVKPKSEEEVKAAYDNYIKNAPSDDISRLSAINRLAELELKKVNDLAKDNNESGPGDDALEDELYRESLQRTLSLLKSSLDEFPDAKSNDKTLYQLARTYEQLGDRDNSLAALRELTRRYPKSDRYAEAQFRLAETAFVMGDYITAEDAYSEALFSDTSNTFYERSLFKRGWSRYKQGLYIEAADDYLAALKNHQFDDYQQLEGSEKDEFNEYFRAIGLAFANLQNADTLQNFFADGPNFKYLYHTYRVISEIYLEQERFSDAAAALAQFVDANPDSPKIPLAKLKIVETWRIGEFKTLFHESLEIFYRDYHPSHSYWHDHPNTADRAVVFNSLRDHSLQLAFYHQGFYNKSRSQQDFGRANTWYSRYLDHYSAYAQQDKVYKGYAELLAAEGQDEQALHYFELAAYDGDIILDKEAAYATIVLSNKLYEKNPDSSKWLDKHLHYSLTSTHLYPTETRYHTVALHAAESAFNNKRYEDAVSVASGLPDSASDEILYEAGVLKGLAYQKSGKPEDAESVFVELLSRDLSNAERREQNDNLALSIYQQAEKDLSSEDVDSAIQHFSRITQQIPQSDIAPAALYEAIVLSMQHQYWHRAISYAEHFQAHYANHTLSKDATRQVSAAYLKAGDDAKAARAFEQLSAQDEDRDVKMAALWQAAELYESKNDFESAIRSYRSYAHTYSQPYPQHIEAMYKLTQLYQATGDTEKRQFWQNKIAETDQKATKSQKTDRTNHLSASVLLDLAREKALTFNQKKLTAPLAENLRVKKSLMQESIRLFGRASVYGSSDITTEATYSIGRIYEDFSIALLESERPDNLKGEELDQYNILIEDQAFPFEEKAIEFYEINLARIKDGASNQWIAQSYKQLASLFPVRYNRKGKLDIYQNEKP